MDEGRNFSGHTSGGSSGDTLEMAALPSYASVPSRAVAARAVADPRLRRELAAMVARRVDGSEVEDLVQATLAEALASPALPTPPEEVRRFVFWIAQQRLVDFYRRRSRKRREVSAEDRPLHDECDDGLVRPWDAPSSAGVTQPMAAMTDLLRWADAAMPPAPEARRTFDWMLRESEGETLAEIASVERVPPLIVRKRVSRLRQHFRARWLKEIGALGLLVVGIVVAFFVHYARSRSSESAGSWRNERPETARSIRPEPSVPAATAANGAFDRRAAASALGRVNVQSCNVDGGPTGPGHVTVTFASDGSASDAIVDSGPFPGTAVGACIAARFRTVSVPAFEGAPVRVGKSFTIE
jgi:DNA-directed RNA polymerase specialized sigma24 family protein